MNLSNDLRKIWMEIPMWRRAYLVSYASGFGDMEAVGEKLYDSPTEIGNILEVFFGDTAARTLENMFREQIVISAEILFAEKAGDTNLINENTEKLYRNIDQISTYMEAINPYWNKQFLGNLFYEYFKSTILEMVTVLAGKYKESVGVHEAMENQALAIADYMAWGIIQYFKG